jgi:hypothetical protein
MRQWMVTNSLQQGQKGGLKHWTARKPQAMEDNQVSRWEVAFECTEGLYLCNLSSPISLSGNVINHDEVKCVWQFEQAKTDN